jgi:hypothetical protein
MLPLFWEGGLAPLASDLYRRGANNSHGGPMLRGLTSAYTVCTV